MDAELKAKWVAALRSRKYEQGRAALHYDSRFCCLGVLGDLIEPTAWDELNGWRGSTGLLPEDACGIDLEIQGDLAAMNDDGDTFPMIADYIEANL